jgi:TrmH family RNA methyltransferase
MSRGATGPGHAGKSSTRKTASAPPTPGAPHPPESPGAAITSRHHPLPKLIRSLRQRPAREASGLSFVEGVRLVAEAGRLGQHEGILETLIVAPDLLRSAVGQGVAAQVRRLGVPCREVSAEVFQSISLRDSPQGIGLLVRQRWTPLDALQLDDSRGAAGGPAGVALDGVRDPGNLGTILRTADAAGSPGVILLGHTADPYDPLAVRASMGALFSQHLVRASFEQLVAWCRRRGYTLVGTSCSATADYWSVSYRAPAVLLMGNERTGLSPAQQAACDVVVRIPMAGRSDSLNLAVATGIVLYELRRAASS